jgi:hypothetical protein
MKHSRKGKVVHPGNTSDSGPWTYSPARPDKPDRERESKKLQCKIFLVLLVRVFAFAVGAGSIPITFP